LDSKNYREVEVLKSSGYLPGRKQVRYPRRHQALIRAQLERFWISEELFRQHPASRIDDATRRYAATRPNVQIARLGGNRPYCRCVFLKRVMDPVRMIIGDVIADQTTQMSIIEDDNGLSASLGD